MCPGQAELRCSLVLRAASQGEQTPNNSELWRARNDGVPGQNCLVFVAIYVWIAVVPPARRTQGGLIRREENPT